MKILARFESYEIVPRYYGFVRDRELQIECAVIPLNLPLSWWHWLIEHLQWKWTAGPRGWPLRRRALAQAYERGRRGGYNQGQAAGGIAAHRAAKDQAREILERLGMGS